MKQSGHENNGHDHTRWICLIFNQMRIQILILGLQGLNETRHPHCIANLNCLHWRKPRRSTFGPTTDWGVVFRSHPSCNSMDYQHYSGRKNVLRKLLRILYRRLKAGFFCVWNDFVCLCRSDELNARDANVCYLYKAFVFVLCFVTWNLLWIQNTDVGEDFTR